MIRLAGLDGTASNIFLDRIDGRYVSNVTTKSRELRGHSSIDSRRTHVGGTAGNIPEINDAIHW